MGNRVVIGIMKIFPLYSPARAIQTELPVMLNAALLITEHLLSSVSRSGKWVWMVEPCKVNANQMDIKQLLPLLDTAVSVCHEAHSAD